MIFNRTLLQTITFLMMANLSASTLALASEPPSPTDPGFITDLHSLCGSSTYVCQNIPCSVVGTLKVTFNASGNANITIPGTKVGVTIKGAANSTQTVTFSSNFVINTQAQGHVCFTPERYVTSSCVSHGLGCGHYELYAGMCTTPLADSGYGWLSTC